MSGHLIGAYGMFWDKDVVNWSPGSGRAAWQMLGKRGKNLGTLQFCDFRHASGFYVLFDDFRANYVGLARGSGGIGGRLRNHYRSEKSWSRFCWFSFDDVKPGADGWAKLLSRDAIEQASKEVIVREAEALLITILGSRDQNQMQFNEGHEWLQVSQADFVPKGSASKLDKAVFTDPQWISLRGNV